MKVHTPARIALAASLAGAFVIPKPDPRPLCRLPCPSAAICIADPNPRCVVPSGSCGGIAAFTCEGSNEHCVDDPRDDCDPGYNGFDCGGVCVKQPGEVSPCAVD